MIPTPSSQQSPFHPQPFHTAEFTTLVNQQLDPLDVYHCSRVLIHSRANGAFILHQRYWTLKLFQIEFSIGPLDTNFASGPWKVKWGLPGQGENASA